MSLFTKVQSSGVATLLLAMSIFLSRFMGLVRDKLISWNFGANIDTDLYFMAFIIPDFINYLLAGGYFSIILVPLLTQYFANNDEQGFRFFNSILLTVAITIISLTCLLWVLTPSIVPFIAKNLLPEECQQLTFFIRIILPAQVFFLIGAVFSALLYMRKQFLVPALMPLIYNGAIILCGILFAKKGIVGYCYGVTIGACIGAFLLPLYTVLRGGFTFFFTFKHKGLITFILLALPLMIGQSITVVEEQFLRIFGSYLSDGSVSILSYARRIMLLPIGVVAQAIGVASYPFLTAMLTSGKKDDFVLSLQKDILHALYLLIPLALFMILVAEHIIAILFYGGAFNQDFVIATTPLLQILLVGVPAWGVQQILVRGFYAHNDTIKPTIIGTLVTIASIPLYYYGVQHFETIGVALASSIAILFYMLTLVLIWNIVYYPAVFKGVFTQVLLTILELLPVSAFLIYSSQFIYSLLEISYTESYFIANIIAVPLYALLFSIGYALTLFITKSPRYHFFYHLIITRILKRIIRL